MDDSNDRTHTKTYTLMQIEITKIELHDRIKHEFHTAVVELFVIDKADLEAELLKYKRLYPMFDIYFTYKNLKQ